MTTRKRRMISAQILQEILNNSDSDIADAESTYSESESVKSDMRAEVETKVKLMMEEWTTTSGFLVTMVTVIERKTKLYPMTCNGLILH